MNLARNPDQVWITTSGIFSQPPFIAALQTFGIDRIMFSVDYPFAPDAKGRKFLNEVSLAPDDMAKLGIVHLPRYEPAAVVRTGARGGPLPLTQLTRGCVLLG